VIRRAIAVIIVVVILGIAANDLYLYSRAQKHVNEVAYELTKWAADNVSMGRDQVAASLVQAAAPQGVTIAGYDQTGDHVTVVCEQEVKGTLVAGTIVNMSRGMSFSQAFGTSFTVSDRREAGFN